VVIIIYDIHLKEEAYGDVLNDFVKVYTPIVAFSLAASGYWYVSAYFGFFGMEEVINELGIAYFVQKSSVIFSALLSQAVFVDADIRSAGGELLIWVFISGFSYWIFISNNGNSIGWGLPPQKNFLIVARIHTLRRVSKIRTKTPKAIGVILVGVPFIIGIHLVSSKLGEAYAWKLVSKNLPYYSQVVFPEANASLSSSGESTSISVLKSELDAIELFFQNMACGQVAGKEPDDFNDEENYNFSVLRSHFRTPKGSGGIVLLEVYRTENLIYLSTVMSKKEEEHFVLRLRPQSFGMARTQIVINDLGSNNQADNLEPSNKHAFLICGGILERNAAGSSLPAQLEKE